MSLDDEIKSKKAKIQTDSYMMSIGELIELYNDSQIELRPRFQRFFRWDVFQKSLLIESLLLGIPIPPIFFVQREDGIWEVVDGLQRLSTIFELAGILKKEDGTLAPRLTLESTKYLPSLHGLTWDHSEGADNTLTVNQKLAIKRAKIDVKIIRDEESKYDIFLRLNTGGSPLSPQEVRNCMMLMENPELMKWLDDLKANTDFQECIRLSDNAASDEYDVELVLRFVVIRSIPIEDLRKMGDITSFLNEKTLELARNTDSWEEHTQAFTTTFRILVNGPRENSFRRYSEEKGDFLGGFLIGAFEVFAMGIGSHYREVEGKQAANELDLIEAIKNVWRDEEKNKYLRSAGQSAAYRIPRTVELGRIIFGNQV